MNPRLLTAENAQVLTATITVKALTVERRQVTLSVFRQLIEEDIVDRDVLRLSGVGWGHVRYLIDEPPDRAIHLVWQKGAELRRCIVERYVDRYTQAYKSQWDADINYEVVHKDRRPGQADKMAFFCNHRWEWGTKPQGRYYYPPELPKLQRPDYPPRGNMEIAAFYRTNAYKSYEEQEESYHAARDEQDKQKTAHKQVAMESYRDWVRDALQLEYDDRCAWCDQYEALVRPLFDLPQLFIAT